MIECRTTCVAAAASARCACAAQAIEGASPRLDGRAISIRIAAILQPGVSSNAANFAPDLVTRHRPRTVETVAYDPSDAVHGSTTGGNSAFRRVGARV